MLCPKGRYQSAVGGQMCTGICPAGTFGDSIGLVFASQCTKCEAGKFANVGASTFCAECPAGTYEDGVGR